MVKNGLRNDMNKEQREGVRIKQEGKEKKE